MQEYIQFLINVIWGIVLLPWMFIFTIPILTLLLGLGVVVFSALSWVLADSKIKRKFRVLLVDDNPNTLVLIKNILKQRNCVLKIIDNGIKAVEELSREKYDLIIMDEFMPGMNGSETLSLADRAIGDRKEKGVSLRMPVIEYSSSNEVSIGKQPMNHFTLAGKLSKKLPPSRLNPLVSDILAQIG